LGGEIGGEMGREMGWKMGGRGQGSEGDGRVWARGRMW